MVDGDGNEYFGILIGREHRDGPPLNRSVDYRYYYFVVLVLRKVAKKPSTKMQWRL